MHGLHAMHGCPLGLNKGTKSILVHNQNRIYSCPRMHFFGPGYFLPPAGRPPAGGKKYPGPKKCIPGHEKNRSWSGVRVTFRPDIKSTSACHVHAVHRVQVPCTRIYLCTCACVRVHACGVAMHGHGMHAHAIIDIDISSYRSLTHTI